jgi:hypothetical protein
MIKFKHVLKSIPKSTYIYFVPDLYSFNEDLDYIQQCINTNTIPSIFPIVDNTSEYLTKVEVEYGKEVVDKYKLKLIQEIKRRDKSTPYQDVLTNSTPVTLYYNISNNIKEELGIIDDTFDKEIELIQTSYKELRVCFTIELDELLGKHIISITNPNLIVIYEYHTNLICLEGLVVDVMCKELHLCKPTRNTKCYV